MQRNVRLCLNDIDTDSADNYKEISIYNLNKLVNDSYDIIDIDILENITPEEAENTIYQSISKLRPGGYLNLSFLNVKKICYDYTAAKIDNQQFLKYVLGKQSIIDTAYINKICTSHGCTIVNLIEQNNYRLSLAILKTGT